MAKICPYMIDLATRLPLASEEVKNSIELEWIAWLLEDIISNNGWSRTEKEELHDMTEDEKRRYINRDDYLADLSEIIKCKGEDCGKYHSCNNIGD